MVLTASPFMSKDNGPPPLPNLNLGRLAGFMLRPQALGFLPQSYHLYLDLVGTGCSAP